MSTADPETGLTVDDVSEVEAFARRYQDKRAACIEALMAVQRRHRWISDRQLREVAALLEPLDLSDTPVPDGGTVSIMQAVAGG